MNDGMFKCWNIEQFWKMNFQKNDDFNWVNIWKVLHCCAVLCCVIHKSCSLELLLFLWIFGTKLLNDSIVLNVSFWLYQIFSCMSLAFYIDYYWNGLNKKRKSNCRVFMWKITNKKNVYSSIVWLVSNLISSVQFDFSFSTETENWLQSYLCLFFLICSFQNINLTIIMKISIFFFNPINLWLHRRRRLTPIESTFPLKKSQWIILW